MNDIIERAQKQLQFDLTIADGIHQRWPNPCDPLDAIRTAYSSTSSLTVDQVLWLADAAHSYGALIYLPTDSSHRRIIQIRRAMARAQNRLNWLKECR